MTPRTLAIGLALAAACGTSAAPIGPTLPPANAPPPPEPVAATRPASKPAVTSDPDTPSGADAARDAELAKRVEPLVDAFIDNGAELTPDGKRVVFRSNRDRLPQLYIAAADRPDAPVTRLVTSGERVGSFAIARDGKYVIFESDKGADENWSLWRVGLDGKEPTELTPGETLNRDPVHLAAKLPGTAFFSARKKEEATSAIYSVPVAGGPAKKLHESDGFGVLLDVSADGKTALFLRLRSLRDTELQLVDLGTGKARKIHPVSGTAQVLDALFAADGRRVFAATDAGGEQSVLLALDVKTGKELARYADPASPTAAVDGCVAPAVTRARLACTVTAGNHTVLRLLDPATLKPQTEVKLPLGTGAANFFSDDGKLVVAAWSTPAAPTEVYKVDARTGQVSPLRTDPRPSIGDLPPLSVQTAEVTAHDGLKIPVHYYLPAGAEAGKKVPVIVDFHGGPAASASIRWNPQARFFTGLGYAWVEPNVRGSGSFGRSYEMADDGPKRRESIKDIESCGKWVAAQPWADKDRLVISGGSYGGYSVLIGLTHWPELWRAGIDEVGVVNWVTFMRSTSGAIRELFITEIGDPDKDRALLEELSPIKDVGKIRAPLFVYAGANDPRVPLSEDDQIVKALRERGVPVEYMVAANEGHSLARRENQIALFSRAARFLEKALK